MKTIGLLLLHPKPTGAGLHRLILVPLMSEEPWLERKTSIALQPSMLRLYLFIYAVMHQSKKNNMGKTVCTHVKTSLGPTRECEAPFSSGRARIV